ncbi:MAG: hypothetical protein QXU12_00625 [Nitrososphaerota archaeon]
MTLVDKSLSEGTMDKNEHVKYRLKCCSPEVMISLMIGDSGETASEYGGVIIKVLDPGRFPWEQVFRALLKLNHEVYVEQQDDSLIIISKPKVD